MENPYAHRAAKAIAMLFVDTELSNERIARIVSELKISGLANHDLDYLYFHVLAPALHKNLKAVPGSVWTDFNDDLIDNLLDDHRPTRSQRVPGLRRIYRWWITFDSIVEWRKVRAQL